MKYSIVIILIAILLNGTTAYSQEGVIGIAYTKSYVDKDFHVSKVYYKGTDTQVPEETFNQLVEEHPNLFLESIIDSEGRVTRYVYDPNLKDSESQIISDSDKKEDFANFKLTTISNETIELSELKGKIVILRFEMEATTFRFKKHEIQELDDKINGLENPDAVAAIIIFDTSKSNVEKGFDLKDSNFKLVANGKNFIEKYGIRFFPSTLVIDQNGNLIDTFKHMDEIDLESYLK